MVPTEVTLSPPPLSPSKSSNPTQMCQHCGKDHDNCPCFNLNNACYKCGSTQNFVKNCPHKLKDAAKPIAKGRVFHLDESNAVPTLVIIQGTLSIHDSTAHALIDTYVTYSFISHKSSRNLLTKLIL